MEELPIKSRYKAAQARLLNRKLKANRVKFTDQEAIIYEAGRQAMAQELKQESRKKS